MGKVREARRARGDRPARIVALDPVADLGRRLARAGAAAKLAAVVRAWWTDHELGAHPASVGKRIALALIEQRRQTSRLAGIRVLHEQLGEHLRVTDLPAFARLFATGHLDDPDVVDAFATKVLVTLLDRSAGRAEVAAALAAWRDAETVWQRRAGCVAFTRIARDGEAACAGLVPLVLRMCATVVWSPARLDQTAVGWLLRELARAEPARVETFFHRHARFMSKECARAAVMPYPAAKRTELLAHHKRATTLR